MGPPWKIEKAVRKGDYLYAKVKGHPNATRNRYVLYHRIVMENKLGRLLEKNEIVHHVNGNKHDNREENLELTTPSEHTKEHVRIKGHSYIDATCPNCGKFFRKKKAHYFRHIKDKGYFSCSKSCGTRIGRLIQLGKLTRAELAAKFSFVIGSTRDPSWTAPIKRKFDRFRRFHKRKIHYIKWFQGLEYPEHLVSRLGKQTKVDWPPVSEIKKMLLEMPLLEIGKRLGCSDNCVKKHCKTMKIELPKFSRGHWLRTPYPKEAT